MIINKFNKHKKQYEGDQWPIKSFDKLHRISLQDDVNDKNENESLCYIFTKYIWWIKKWIFFITMNKKLILNNLEAVKENFNLEPRT